MNQNKRLIIILMTLSFIFTFIGGTLAYWNWQTSTSQKTNIVASVSDMCLVSVDGGGSIDSSSVSMMPTTCTNTNNAIIKEINSSVLFTDSEIPVQIVLSLKVNDISDELTETTHFKYAITDSPTDCVSNAIASGSFNGVEVNDTIELVSDIYTISDIDSNRTANSKYYLYIWLDKEETNPNTAGTSFDLSLTALCNVDNEYVKLNDPVLDSGMIPVTISSDGTVTTISEDDNTWYDYSKQKWANAILVTELSRSSYLNTTDVVVQESDILGYYVWIPRYKYKIWTTSASSAGNEQEIEIIFENKNTPKSNGTAVGEYLTHPAFTFGNQELSGFWVGKFETTGTGDNPTVLPNTTSLRGQNISTQFQTSLKFAGGTLSDGNVTFAGSSTYGLSKNADSHMMKNSEWGAVAYLSHSKYGINEEIYINNSSSFYTGRSGGNVGGSVNTLATQFSDTSDSSSNTYNNYGYYTWLGQSVSSDGTIGTITNSSLGTKASTTGNITGIYDMSGGGTEYVMGVYSDSSGNPRSGNNSSYNSGFNGAYSNGSKTDGIDFPSSKYYDLYLQSQFTGDYITNNNYCILATCGGHALYETANWYSDYSHFVDSFYPWFLLGGYYDSGSNAGAFYSNSTYGGSYINHSFRSVLAPIESYKVSYVNNFFTTSNQTISGVTVSYDATTSYLTLNGTQTAGIGLMSPDFEFKEGDKYKFTLTYVSGSFTANGSYAIGLDAAKSNLSHTSTRNHAQMSFPIQGSNSVILTINSAAEEEASKLNNWIWQSSSGTLTYNNYVVKIEVTKVVENNIQYNDNYVLPNTPTKTGYKFLGWYTSPNGGTKITNSTVMNMTNDHSLYAQWAIDSYTLSITRGTGISTIYYKLNDASNYSSSSSSVSMSVNYGTTYSYYGVSSTGYTLSSCTSSSPCTGTVGASNKSIDLSATINTYTISYNANGGIGAPGSQTKTYGVALTLSSTKPTRTGYTFLGWATSSSATSATYAAGGSYTTNSAVTLYAVWKKKIINPISSYSCSNGNAGTSPYDLVYTGNCTVINDGQNNWRVKFLTSGTLTISSSTNIDIFAVGGGGGGGYASDTNNHKGGGGGYTTTYLGYTLTTTSIKVTIGAGGAVFNSGGTSSFGSIVSAAGGTSPTESLGGSGGSGGGNNDWSTDTERGGAGGSDGSDGQYNGGKGQGTTTREFSESTGTLYSGGGGGGTYGYCGAGEGGAGGGGKGACYHTDAEAGTANTGGGGGGGYFPSSEYGSAAAGGSGIVIIRNARSKPAEHILYISGNQNVSVTGGWLLSGVWGSGYDNNGTVTFNSSNMKVVIPGHGSDFLRCKNKIDVTNYSKLNLTYEKTVSGDKSDIHITVASDLTEGEWALSNLLARKISTATSGTISVDISSLSGKQYVGIGMAVNWTLNSETYTITKVWLE